MAIDDSGTLLCITFLWLCYRTLFFHVACLRRRKEIWRCASSFAFLNQTSVDCLRNGEAHWAPPWGFFLRSASVNSTTELFAAFPALSYRPRDDPAVAFQDDTIQPLANLYTKRARAGSRFSVSRKQIAGAWSSSQRIVFEKIS